ncbi:hypothetical protein [Prevotella koreensis]|uniref:Lipoprotein n=1 Tax=Prevotella koreensis TaxID=2490854 RepID=A0A432LH28_9BACT|nr:hypothetical protein [Prevotella koreensis]RUL58384.1 hypothetical protein EHV08_00425 [Prevotella koreensis]
MKQNNFFANAANKALALAAAVMMSAAFTSCSKDSDDDNGSLPTPKAQTVTIDGVEKPILKAEYEDNTYGNYDLYFYLSADRKKNVLIQLNKDLHMTGKPINLTKKEESHEGKWYWAVDYKIKDDVYLIETLGKPGTDDPVFSTGTLTVSGLPTAIINIKLENGRVKGSDGKKHTLTLSYKGKMNKK